MRRARTKAPPEEGIAIRVVILVAVVVSAWAALDETATGTTLHAVVLVGLPLGFAFSYFTRRRTGWLLKTLLTIGLLLAFAQFLRAVGELQGESVSDVQTPLAELFIWVQLLHAFDVPGRRDLMFSLASSAVLAAIAAVLSVSLVVAPLLAVWAVASIAGLALAHRSSLAELPGLAPLGLGGADARDRRADLGWMRPVVATIAAVAVLGAGLFMVVPAAGTARALAFPASIPRVIAVPNGGGLVNPSLGPRAGTVGGGSSGGGGGGESFGYFGFAPTLDTSVRGRPDDTLVMRVRASSPDFWRGQTFDHFDGRVWSRTDDEPHPIRSRSPFFLPRVPLDGPRPAETSELVQTYYLEQTGPNVLFAANTPDELYFSDRTVYQLPDGSLRAGVQLERDAAYTVISHRADATAETLRASAASAADPATTPAEITARYTQADDVPARVRDLAARITRDAATPYDAVRALEGWMGRNTRYTLDVPKPPRGADAVEQFLFVDRKGFCEQIATSLVVMLRSLGIPARLAVGYLPGERNPFTGLYEVRADDAHAWAEVYFPGVGWQGFDPTAPVPLAGDTTGAAAGAGALAYLSARLPAAPTWLPEAGMVALFALAAATVPCVVVRRRVRRQAARARSWGVIQLERFEAIGAARGRPRRLSETVPEFADALDDPGLDRAAQVIDHELYSGRPTDPDDRAAVETILTTARSIP